MAIESVRIAVLADATVPAGVDGVVVRFFDQAGVFLATATTGELEPGAALVELPGSLEGEVYTARFFQPGAEIAPRRIRVFSPPELAPEQTNDFVVDAVVFSPRPAPDPMMCRASGYVIGPTGNHRARADLVFTPQFHAFVDRARATLTGSFTAQTDDKGFVSVDLYRYGIYTVEILGLDPLVRTIEVPNRAAMVIGYLLFPVVIYAIFREATPFAVARGQTLYVTPVVMASNYKTLGLGLEDVFYDVADPTVASVQVFGDRIAIRGLREGTTTFRVNRLDRSIVYLPDPGITGGEVTLTVTDPTLGP